MLSSWNCCVFALFVLSAVYLNVVVSNDVHKFALPDCGNKQEPPKIVIVSTLDGKISALNINGGTEKWSIATGPGAMLSSSIHTLELTNKGQYVRMIPSLSGGLYKFSEESVEPLPINAEHLLKSSFRYSSDLVISGGKESRTYGIHVGSGRIMYECSMAGCDNLTSFQKGVEEGDVVIIQRQTQTIRAVEPRSGVEKWNFSVGQHDVKLAPDPSSDCFKPSSTDDSDLFFKVIVPDGLVCALSKSTPGEVIWQHKFESPVVNAWQVDHGELKLIDLFGGEARTPIGENIPQSPLLYIGMHNKQLYIQESVTLQNKLEGYFHHLIAGNMPSIPWKPVPASRKTLGIAGPSEPIGYITDESQEDTTTALSVLYASEYVNGNGFWLFESPSQEGSTESTALCPKEEKDNSSSTQGDGVESERILLDEEESETVKIIVVSLSYYWKEVLIVSLTTAIVVTAVNFGLQMKFNRGYMTSHVTNNGQGKVSLEEGEKAPKQELPDLILSQSVPIISLPIPSVPTPPPSPDFVSRYLTDFEPVQCLGKGGFGVVFQAKNKIDDCHYAIKRIPLPNKEESREKVMREVKALAKLDHQNIVRYFNAWLECPPPEWQKTQDSLQAEKFREDQGAVTVDLSGHVTPTSDAGASVNLGSSISENKSKHSNIFRSIWNKATSVYSSSNALEESLACSTRPIGNFDDESDSFIVFEGPKDSVPGELNGTVASDKNFMIDKSEDSEKDCKKVKRPKSLMLDDTSGRAASSRFPRMYLYIQMQLCRRESLREWLRATTDSRDIKQSLNIFDQIVQAVEYVHLQGLIHRDLKPSNIFFSPDGQIKVGDFGLVTAMVEGAGQGEGDGQWRATSPMPGVVIDSERHTARVGTQLYMSPEQLTGKQYNYKVDIYSLGLILFELLVPFTTEMERVSTLTQVRSNKFPRKFQQNYSKEYELLSIMLSKIPEERPTTIGIRWRSPLRELQPDSALNEDWHFSLPSRHRDTSFSRSSGSGDS